MGIIVKLIKIIFLLFNNKLNMDFINLEKNLKSKFLNKNIGIAAAQNVGIELAFKSKASRIIFFDQDSNPEPNMISGAL